MEASVKNLCEKVKELMRLPATGDLTEYLKGETAFLVLLKNSGKKTVTPSYLSDELGVTKGRITAIINSLSEKGMVTLGQVEGDRRKVDVRITKAGVEYIDKKLDNVGAFVNEFCNKMSKDKVDELVSLMDDAIAVMKDMRVSED